MSFPTQQILKRWLTPDDFEQEFGMSKETQAKKRSAGDLPYSKIGRFIFYDRNKLDILLEKNNVENMARSIKRHFA